MKVQTLKLNRFKRFADKQLDFRDEETGLAKDLIVLVGANGSGKSTILQAIAALVATATGRITSPRELNWPGFNIELASQAWAKRMEIEVQVEFAAEEITATQDYYRRTQMSTESGMVTPGENSIVTLHYQPDSRVAAKTRPEYFQFRGRSYARSIFDYAEERFALFERVGDIFWYTEERTTNSLSPIEGNGKPILYNMDLVRRRLSDLFNFHERIQRGDYNLRPGQRDLFYEIQKVYQTIFTRNTLHGPVPKTGFGEDILEEPWFYLYDGQHEYELSEMSAGERAIFPILFDFAYWNIHHSIILIDELELHLHPPYQQALLVALRKLGHNNQFIITTHSDVVADIVPPSAIYRL